MNAPHLDWEAVGGRPLVLAEEAHARECPACLAEAQRLAALRAALRASMPIDLAARIQLSVAAELARNPQPPAWRRAWVAASSLALVAGMPGWLLPARDAASLPDSAGRMAIGCLLALAFVIPATLAFRPALRVSKVVPGLVVALAAAALLVEPGARSGDIAGIHPGCLAAVLMTSALPLAVLLFGLRREELTPGRGLLAAMAAGAVGEGLVYRHCPVGTPGHILGAHLGGWAILIALGFWLGERLRPPLWQPRRLS